MTYYVYMLKTIEGFKKKTYVGYTNDINKRLIKHNLGKGAKSTRGYQWIIIYKKSFKLKSKALSFEYKLKKDKNKRLLILKDEKN
jgi:putative endonuclease